MTDREAQVARDRLAWQLAEARHRLAREETGKPAWATLTDPEREAAMRGARSYLRALYSLLEPTAEEDFGQGKINRSKADLRLSYAVEVRLVEQLDRELPGGLAADQRALLQNAAVSLRNLAAFRDALWAVRPSRGER
jgi:hypothetical protein